MTYRTASLAFAALLLPTLPLAATDPLPWTWVVRQNGNWELRNRYLGGAALVLQDQDRGIKKHLVINDLLPRADLLRHARPSTGGPLWGEDAFWYFTQVESRPFFCIHLSWGERLVFDLDEFKPVTDLSPILHHLKSREVELVKERLHEATRLQDEHDPRLTSRLDEYQAAILLATRRRLIEVAPLLTHLEASTAGDRSSLVTHMNGQNGFDPAAHSVFPLRRLVQFSLRRLGMIPRGYPATRLLGIGGYHEHAPEEPLPRRGELADGIKSGMRAGLVIEALGAPDYIDSDNPVTPGAAGMTYWRYDIDSDPPWTLLVTVQHDEVLSARKLDPPVWKTMDAISDRAGLTLFQADGALISSAYWNEVQAYYGWSLLTWILLGGAVTATVVGLTIWMRRWSSTRRYPWRNRVILGGRLSAPASAHHAA